MPQAQHHVLKRLADPERKGDRTRVAQQVHLLGNDIAHPIAGQHVGQRPLLGQLTQRVGGGLRAGSVRLQAHIVGQVRHVQAVARAPDPRARRLHALVHPRTAGQRVQRNAGSARQLVLGDQADRQEKQIAGHDLRMARVQRGDLDRLQPWRAQHARHRAPQPQRDIQVVQALDHVAGQSGSIGQDLSHLYYLCPFQDHAAGHDQSNVARPQHHHAPSRQIAADIHQPLCRPGREHPGGPRPRQGQVAPCALPAACAEDRRPRPDLLSPLPRAE